MMFSAPKLEELGSTCTCSSCGRDLPLASFGVDKRAKSGRKRVCKDCHNDQNRRRYHRDVDRAREYHRKKRRGYYSESRDFDPVRWMLDLCRNRARREGIPYSLTRDDLIIPERCPVLGLRLRRPGEGQAEDSPSIDRIVPERGYVSGNVAVISMRANRLKNDGSAEEHERIAAWMRENGGT